MKVTDEICRFKVNYSQVVLSPENIRLSFEEGWRAQDRLKFLLNQGIALDTSYIVKTLSYHPNYLGKSVLIGINFKKEGDNSEKLHECYAGFFELLNPLPGAKPKKQIERSLDNHFDKYEQLLLSIA